jgi:hypothetical protein
MDSFRPPWLFDYDVADDAQMLISDEYNNELNSNINILGKPIPTNNFVTKLYQYVPNISLDKPTATFS